MRRRGVNVKIEFNAFEPDLESRKCVGETVAQSADALFSGSSITVLVSKGLDQYRVEMTVKIDHSFQEVVPVEAGSVAAAIEMADLKMRKIFVSL